MASVGGRIGCFVCEILVMLFLFSPELFESHIRIWQQRAPTARIPETNKIS